MTIRTKMLLLGHLWSRMSCLHGGTVRAKVGGFKCIVFFPFLVYIYVKWSKISNVIRTNLERKIFWNPDAIRTKSDKIWLPPSGHKWQIQDHLYKRIHSKMELLKT